MREILRCDLSELRLTSLLQLIDVEGLDGALQIEGFGQLGLAQGAVVSARCATLAGHLALRTLFFLDRGQAVLLRGPPAEGRPLAPLLQAIMDAARLRDEWARLAPTIFAPAPGLEASSPALAAVLARLDGARTLQEVVVACKVSPAAVLDGLLDLGEQGRLTEVGLGAEPGPWPGISALEAGAEVPTEIHVPAPASPPPAAELPQGRVDPAAARALREQGRRHLREGRLDEAVAAMLAAQALDPTDTVGRAMAQHVVAWRELGVGRLVAWLAPEA